MASDKRPSNGRKRIVPKPPIRLSNGRFGQGMPGPGRPKGSVSRATLEVIPIKEMAAELLQQPEYLKALAIRLKAGDAPHMEKFFAEHLWGKPKETVDLNITQTHISVLLSLSDLELGAFLSAMEARDTDGALRLLPGSAA